MHESLIDQLNPEGSDDEDDPAALTEFTLDVQQDAGCTTTPEECSAVIVCAGSSSDFLKAVIPSLKPAPWVLKDTLTLGPSPKMGCDPFSGRPKGPGYPIAQVLLFFRGRHVLTSPEPKGEGAVMFSCRRNHVFSWKGRLVSLA